MLWIEKAEDTLFTSDFNLKNELTIAAINRAYYSMFYCTTSLLRSKSIVTKSHSGTISKFNELFIKSKLINPEFASMLKKAFDFRQSCDYDIEVKVTEKEAAELVRYAHEFLAMTKAFIN